MVLFFQIGRSVTKAQEDARAEVLERQIDAYLRSSERVQSLLEDTARLRHDLRNHQGVVRMLCDRGDYERAQAYLDEISERIADA